MTNEEIQNIKYLYQTHTAEEVAILTGYSVGTIAKYGGRVKNKVRKKAKKVNPQDIMHDYVDGMTDLTKLQEKYGCCLTTIYSAITDVRQPRIKQRYEVEKAIRNIPTTGEKMISIAKRFNVSEQYVYYVREKIKKENSEDEINE